ncbi:DNA sulfur modification protein DndB [Shouchella lehensis]|uniref:DGQHR domain-containing protein n=1 Tax=Shouchella lehensis G1 TaxID=1246626 RepID=A0A060LZC8_9BACI|nr:DNA sulfur modification protein DndB [Shouchella lehensis]AIC93174.1 hypothetical protein BleG1_0566 [Shouchella lehensis G1]
MKNADLSVALPNQATLTNSIHLPALKYTSGNRTWYAATLEYSVLGKLIQTSAVKKKNQKIIGKEIRNRFLDNAHKNEIIQYIKDEPEFTLPAITLVSYDSLDFRPYQSPDGKELDTGSGISSGILNIPLGYEFECLDGNHRTAAIRDLAYEEPEYIDGSSMLVNIVHENRAKKIRQDFVDVNKNAKSTTASINTLFNTRDKTANIVVDLIENVEWLNDTTERLAASVSKNSKDIYTVNNIRNTVIEIAGFNSQAKADKLTPALQEDSLFELVVRERADIFLSNLKANHFVEYALNFRDQTSQARNQSLILTGTGIIIAARIAGYIFQNFETPDMEKEIKRLFALDWSRENELFIGRVIVNEKVTNSRESIQSTVAALKENLGYQLSDSELKYI